MFVSPPCWLPENRIFWLVDDVDSGAISAIICVFFKIFFAVVFVLGVVTVDGESCCGETEMRIKREVKTESPDFAAGDDEGGDDQVADGSSSETLEEETLAEGCSRTMARMPEASLLKWHQRRQKRREEQLQVIHEAAMTVVDGSHTPPPPADLQSVASIPKRKALIHPQRKHNAGITTTTAVAPIPVGIAVARQRRDKCRSDTPMPLVQPKARRAAEQSSPYSIQTDRLCMSTPSAAGGSGSSELFSSSPLAGGLVSGGGNYPSGRTVYNPAALYAGYPASATATAAANWAWSNPAGDYTAAHSLWPPTDMNSIMAYPSYPPTPPASSVSSPLLHHHHHPASGLTTPPFLLIPTACLGEHICIVLFVINDKETCCAIHCPIDTPSDTNRETIFVSSAAQLLQIGKSFTQKNKREQHPVASNVLGFVGEEQQETARAAVAPGEIPKRKN